MIFNDIYHIDISGIHYLYLYIDISRYTLVQGDGTSPPHGRLVSVGQESFRVKTNWRMCIPETIRDHFHYGKTPWFCCDLMGFDGNLMGY